MEMTTNQEIKVTYGEVKFTPSDSSSRIKLRELFSWKFFSTAATVFIIIISGYTVISKDYYIAPIGLPDPLKSLGYSESVAAYRLQDAIENLYIEVLNSNENFDVFGIGQTQELIDVDVLDTGVSVVKIWSAISEIFGFQHRVVTGEFVCRNTCEPKDIQMRLRIAIDGVLRLVTLPYLRA